MFQERWSTLVVAVADVFDCQSVVVLVTIEQDFVKVVFHSISRQDYAERVLEE